MFATLRCSRAAASRTASLTVGLMRRLSVETLVFAMRRIVYRKCHKCNASSYNFCSGTGFYRGFGRAFAIPFSYDTRVPNAELGTCDCQHPGHGGAVVRSSQGIPGLSSRSTSGERQAIAQSRAGRAGCCQGSGQGGRKTRAITSKCRFRETQACRGGQGGS